MNASTSLAHACWPLARLGEALPALARHAGLPVRDIDLSAPQALPPADPGLIGPWLDWASARLGLEVEPAYSHVPEVLQWLPHAGPALLPWTDAQGQAGLLLLLPGGRSRVRLLTPDGQIVRMPTAALREALCHPAESALEPEIVALLQQARVPARRAATVRAALLRERLADTRLAPWWQLRLPPSAPLRQHAWQARMPQRLAWMGAVFAALYAGEVAGWGVIGQAMLGGRLDTGWLIAWALLLFTLLPLRLAGVSLNASLAQRAATWLKARLLVGALHMDVDRIRKEGVGQLLGRVIESSALESLAIGGGLSTVVALIEGVAAAGVLALGAAPVGHLILLLVWAAGVLLMSLHMGRRLGAWTTHRLALTHDLIEQMVGHRTRLAQERPARRDARDDAALHDYLLRSQALDRSLTPLQVGVPAGWMTAALAVLVPGFLAHDGATGPSAGALAVSVGGILLAQRAFAGMVGGLSSLVRAGTAWRQVADLYHAARPDPARTPMAFVPPPDAPASGPLLEARGLHFAHRPGTPVLNDLHLRIDAGERILLQGASGGGKSTLAALLTGLRRPQAGQLRLRGVEAPALGDAWHSLATAAPQFHDNHVFSGTVAFNLLMGGEWPPTPSALHMAQDLCEALGLGELLKRMPAGLQQRIGETGWQLSHGERSRIFLARALLQGAPLTVLDESFAALDPESLMQCLRCVQARAHTLVVIAHP